MRLFSHPKEYPKFFIFIPAISVIVLVAGFLVVKNNLSVKHLWQYVPANAVAFVEFDLADKKLNDYLKKNNQAKNNLEKFFLDNQLPAEVWNNGIEIQRVALFLAFDKEGRLRQGWVIQSKNNISQLSAFLKNFYFKPIDNRIAIITREKEMSEVIKQQVNFSSLDRSSQQKIDGAFVYGFGQIDPLLVSSDETGWKKLMEDNFRIGDKGLIYWWGKINNEEQIEITLETPLVLKNGWNHLNSMGKVGNKYFTQALTLHTGGIKNIWPAMEQILNEEGGDQKQVEEYVNNKYQIAVKDLYTIFEQPFDLVIKPKNTIRNFDNLWQWDSNDCALITTIDDNEERERVGRNWGTFLTNYLAFKFPEKRVKELPDRTKGYEVVIAPEKFQITGESYKGVELRFIQAGDFNPGYFFNGSQLVIFNSLELAKQIWDEENNQKADGSLVEGEDVVLDTGILGFPYLNFVHWLGLEIKNQGGQLVGEGRLFN